MSSPRRARERSASIQIERFDSKKGAWYAASILHPDFAIFSGYGRSEVTARRELQRKIVRVVKVLQGAR